MTIKELAETIEARTGKKMSRQNLTQRLGRDNFQEQDMRMIAAILEYLQYLEGAGVLNPGESWCEIDVDAQANWLRAQGVDVGTMTEQEIREAQTGSWVFIKAGGRLVDAMEDFQVSFDALSDLAA